MLPSFKMATQLSLLPKLLHLWSSTMPTRNVDCLPVSLEQNDSTPMSLAVHSLLRVTISLLDRSTSRIWQIHQFIYREYCSDSKPMMSPSSIDLAQSCWLPYLIMHPQGFRDTSRHHHQPCTHHT